MKSCRWAAANRSAGEWSDDCRARRFLQDVTRAPLWRLACPTGNSLKPKTRDPHRCQPIPARRGALWTSTGPAVARAICRARRALAPGRARRATQPISPTLNADAARDAAHNRPRQAAVVHRAGRAAGGRVVRRAYRRRPAACRRATICTTSSTASMWFQYPRIKAALNARQAAAIDVLGVGPTRGGVRDALTLFDENAVLFACADASLSAALCADSTGTTLLVDAARTRGARAARRASSATRCWKSWSRRTRRARGTRGSWSADRVLLRRRRTSAARSLDERVSRRC